MRFGVLAVLVLGFACKKTEHAAEGFTAGEGQCLVDHDCVISCDVRGECCVSPDCENVQHKDLAAANAAFNAKDCTDDKRKSCPDIGSRKPPNYRLVPKCQAGTCIGEKIPNAAPDGSSTTPAGSGRPGGGSEVVDTTGYDRTCKTKADCKIVKDDPCNRCSCADKAIAAAEVSRFEATTAAIQCGPRQKIACGECRGSFADCLDGKCIAKPE